MERLGARLTAHELGDALLFYIGIQTGRLFFPYRIVKSSFVPPEIIQLEVADKPLGPPVKKAEAMVDVALEGARFKLSRQDICDALSIGLIHKGNTRYEGNVIKTLPPGIPDSMEIELKYVPKDSENAPHVFGGI